MSACSSHRDDLCLAVPSARPPAVVKVPKGAWDTHAHVAGVPPKYPLVPLRPFTAPETPASDYVKMLDVCGLDYGLLVQLNSHGYDNSLLVDSLRAFPGRLKGIAYVPLGVADAELDRLCSAGVVGVRYLPNLDEAFDVGHVQFLLEICAELRWQLQLGIGAEQLPAVIPALEKSDVTIVIDHMGRLVDPQDMHGKPYQAMRYLAGATDCYVKISVGNHITTTGRPLGDLSELVGALVRDMPDKLLWASNWPFVGIYPPASIPEPHEMIDILDAWIGDERMIRKILVTNPARLFGAPPGSAPRPAPKR